jgi:hypothetical protein
MQAIRRGSVVTLLREKGDVRYKPTGKQGNSWGDGESHLLYHLQQKIKNGEVENWGDLPTDVIKKRMWKDGHLVDDRQLYIRSRKQFKSEDGKEVFLALFNDHWAINGLNDDFNEDGTASVLLTFV